jgi:hypothetical protein
MLIEEDIGIDCQRFRKSPFKLDAIMADSRQRETGHSKNTVKKVLRGEYCGYRSRTSQPYPVHEVMNKSEF